MEFCCLKCPKGRFRSNVGPRNLKFDRKWEGKDREEDEKEEQLQVIDGETNMEDEQEGMIMVEDKDDDWDDDEFKFGSYMDLM